MLVSHDAAHVTGGDQHPGDEHGKRRVYPGQQLQRLSDQGRQRDPQQIDAQPHHNGIQYRGAHQTAGNLFYTGTAADKTITQRPQQNVEHSNVGTGIQKTFGAEQRRNKREAHVRRVGKNAGKPENGHPAAGLACREQQGDHGAQQNGQDTHAKSRQQITQDLGAELHAVRVYHHGRHDDVHQQIGKRLLVFQLEHTGLDRHHACADQQEQVLQEQAGGPKA